MTRKLNKLALFSVGVAGFGLLACGTGNKDGDPQPVDSATVRQALVGNSKAMAADISRTSQFLEGSSILNNGIGLAYRADVSVCAATPDGPPADCGPEPSAEPQELDTDVNGIAAEWLDELERRVLADANIEAQEEFAITYLVSGAVACAVPGEPLDAECVADVDAAQIRLVVTSPAAGDVDVDLLIGPNRVNPLSAQIHQDLVALEADLGAIKDSAAHLGGITGEPIELPATFEGRIRLELNAPSDHEVGAAFSVLQAVKVADGDYSFSIGQSLPAFSLKADSTAKTLVSTSNIGAVDGSFRNTTFSYDSASGAETESSYDLGFHLAGLTGTTLLDVASEVLTVTGMGLGSSTSTMSVDGQRVAAIDLNAADGRTLNATVKVEADDALRIEVDPKFDVSLALEFAKAAGALGEIDDWMLDDVLRITLAGAAKPAVLLRGEDVEVLAGSLTLELENAAITHTITAGQCLLAPNDAPTVDGSETDPDPSPIEEGSFTPLDDLIVGACQ